MGISLKDAYSPAADTPPASSSTPAKPKTIKLSDAYAKPADEGSFNTGSGTVDTLLSADQQIGTRFMKGVGEIPGIPADLLQLAGQYPQLFEAIPGLGPVVRAEALRQAKEGKAAPIPLGSENFSRMEQDWLGFPKPPAPKGELENVLGNVSEFAGSSIGPGGLTKGALKAAAGGGTMLTGAQEIFPDNPLAQLAAALVGGHTPGAVGSIPSKLRAAAKPMLRGTTAPGRAEIVGETLNNQLPKPGPLVEHPEHETPIFHDRSVVHRRGANDQITPLFVPDPMSVIPGMPLPQRVRSSADLSTPANSNRVPGSTAEELTVRDGKIVREPIDTGVKPTLGQARNDENLLALQEHAAGKDPKLKAELARREAENKTAARTTLENIRGPGIPAAATEHAGALTREAEQAAAAERTTIRTQKDQAALSDTARDRLERIRTDTRKEENRLWGIFRERGNAADVPVGPLRESLQNWLKQQDIVPEMPAELERALKQFETGEGKGRVNVTKIQALRPELRELRQTAEAAGDARTARVYSGLEDVVGRYLDRITFKDPELQQAYQAARDFTKQRVAIWKLPKDIRAVMGSDAQGADRVAAGSTLKRFVKSGPEGRDSIRQLLAADSSPEMHQTVADYLAAEMPEAAGPARKWLQNHEPMLREMGESGPSSWYDRFNGVIDRQAALEALRKSPLGMLNDLTPEQAVQRIMGGVDPLKQAKTLKSQMASNPDAWAGMQRSFADEIIGRITKLGERDLNDRPSISPGDLTRLTHEQGALARVFLGDQGVKTLEAIDQALQQVNRRASGGLADPKAALPSLTGHRFLDKIIEKYADPQTGALTGITTGAGAGYAVAGPIGAAVGAPVGYGAHVLASGAQEPLQELFRSALMNPEVGNALMHTASVKSMPAVPKELRSFLRGTLAPTQGAVGATMGAPQKEQPGKPKPKQRVSMAEPSQAMPDGMGFVRQAAAPDQSGFTGQGGGDGRGHPMGRALNERKAREGKPIDPTPEAVWNGWAGPKPGVNPDGTTYDPTKLPRSGEGTHKTDDRTAMLDLLQPAHHAEPKPAEEPARLPKHPVTPEQFAAMTPQAQKHLLDALMTSSMPDMSDIDARRQQNVADEMKSRKEFPGIANSVDAAGAAAEDKVRIADAHSTGARFHGQRGASDARIVLPNSEDMMQLFRMIKEMNQKRLNAMAKHPAKPQPLGGMNRLDTR